MQQRIVLRNAATDFNTMLLMIQLAWQRWRSGKGRISFPLLIATFALVHYLLFLAAGTFSNNLIDAGPWVLARSPRCGVFNETYLELVGGQDSSSLSNIGLWLDDMRKINEDVQLSLQYARECYHSQNSSTKPASCNTLPKPYLEFTTTIRDDFCPFEPQMCHNQSKTIHFDTGHIDSHHDLGINAPENERVTSRRVTNCAVLNDTGYILDVETPANSTSGSPCSDCHQCILWGVSKPRHQLHLFLF